MLHHPLLLHIKQGGSSWIAVLYFVCFFCIVDVVSLFSLECPVTLYVDQYGLKLRDPPASVGIKDMWHNVQPHKGFLTREWLSQGSPSSRDLLEFI